MSHWKRLSRKHRTLYLVIAVLALAATALASGRLTPAWKADTGKADGTVSLGGTLPPPADVFIQQTADFPDLGNVLLTVKLTPEQVAAKQKDGTVSYTTLGSLGELLFRDDGEGGDAVAGDALYTAVARVDPADLAKRAEQDAATLRTASAEIPLFSGRAFTGSQTQAAFDIAGFQAGRSVRMNQPVINVDPHGGGPWPVDPIDPLTPFQHHVLMITDPKVIADPTRTTDPCDPGSGTPGGVWTFKHLVTEMAANTGLSPSAFTENWLQTWLNDQTINTFGVPKRLVMQGILNDWHAVSSTSDLDLDLSPFRLIAIVPRLDLRGGPGSGGSSYTSVAGELRFIFGFVRPGWMSSLPAHSYGGGCALPFTAIFEYKIPSRSCSGLAGLARQWSALDGFVPGDPDDRYNSALTRLTEPVVRANASPGQPYGSAIGQVRTNEIALADLSHWPADPWQLREFHLSTSSWWNPLGETTTANTADDSFNNSTSDVTLQNWILGTIAPALIGPPWNQPILDIPANYPASPFQGARPEMPTTGFFWTAPGLNLSPSGGDNADNWGRHRVSLNSCNGCHAGETGTPFVHVDPTKPLGDWHALSGFLRGITVADPAEAGGLPHRTFSDLARREADIRALGNTLCAEVAQVDVAQVHAELVKTGKLPKHPFPAVITDDQLLSLAVDDLKANHITEVH